MPKSLKFFLFVVFYQYKTLQVKYAEQMLSERNKAMNI